VLREPGFGLPPVFSAPALGFVPRRPRARVAGGRAVALPRSATKDRGFALTEQAVIHYSYGPQIVGTGEPVTPLRSGVMCSGATGVAMPTAPPATTSDIMCDFGIRPSGRAPDAPPYDKRGGT
jgi:hypothetical protein